MLGAVLSFDEQQIEGQAFGAAAAVQGELVFNTAMSGYEEVLTDPSYAGQIIVFTYPHMGNTGINFQDHESKQIYAQGVVVKALTTQHVHHHAKFGLSSWLKQNGVPGISGVNTRAIVQAIRAKGLVNATLRTEGVQHKPLGAKAVASKMELIHVGKKEKHPLVVVDLGVKHSIVKQLCQSEHPVWLVGQEISAVEVIKKHPHAVIFSNGPFDPKDYPQAIALAKDLAQTEIPLLGICLGCQIIALALGANTQKLPFGHHGINHPIQSLQTKQVFISSQNHNYVIEESSLPPTLEITYRSLFDQTIQGFRHQHKPIIAFQGHPEAGPGPVEMQHYFKHFMEEIA